MLKQVLFFNLIFLCYLFPNFATDFYSKFHQRDYKIDFQRVELEDYNKSFFNFVDIKTFKYNRTSTVANITINSRKNMSTGLEMVTQMYKFLSNEYRIMRGSSFQLNFCKAFTANIAGMQIYFNCGNFKSCQIVQVQIDAEIEEILTCETLIKDSIKFAVLLQKFSIKKGDIVSLIDENSIRYCEFLLGAWYNGVLFNPLNMNYSVGELKHALGISQPKLIICSKKALDKVIQLESDFNFSCDIVTIGNEAEKDGHYRDIKNLLLQIEVDVETFKPVDLNCYEDGALVMLSSGTTGLPKCVVLSHYFTRSFLGTFKDLDYCSTSLVTVQVNPSYHLSGFGLQYASIFFLKTIVMKKFNPDLFLKMIEKYRANVLYSVPAILQFLVCKHPLIEKYDITSLRDFVVGGANVGKTLLNEAQSRLKNVFVREMYGSTEVGMALIQKRTLYKPTSSGRLCKGLIAKVCDINSKKAVGPFEQGEFRLKSKQVMKGYLRNDSATRDSFDEDGFYCSGDYGYYDNDKCFYLTDRLKELIKYKGFQVPPAELESLINSIPGVQECGVVGIPDKRAGEVPLAFVVKQKLADISENDIINFVAENISFQKHLYGGVEFIDEIPKTGSGKMNRSKLRELTVSKYYH